MACSPDCRCLTVLFILGRRRAADRLQGPILPSPIPGPGCPKGTALTTRCRWISLAVSAEAYRCAESTPSPKFWMTETPTTPPPPEMPLGWYRTRTIYVQTGD